VFAAESIVQLSLRRAQAVALLTTENIFHMSPV
jgi:hypothetical protein